MTAALLSSSSSTLCAARRSAASAGPARALPLRRRAGVVRVANIAAPAEEMLGQQGAGQTTKYEVGPVPSPSRTTTTAAPRWAWGCPRPI